MQDLLLLLLLLHNLLLVFFLVPADFKAENLLVINLVSGCFEEASVWAIVTSSIAIVMLHDHIILHSTKRFFLEDASAYLAKYVREEDATTVPLHPLSLNQLESQRLIGLLVTRLLSHCL